MNAKLDIRAAVLRAPNGKFHIERVQLDYPRDNEVLVKLVATGLCHTDLAVVNQILPLQMPWVLGHEGAGIVEAAGKDVTSVSVGDHVVLSFSSCGCCENCRKNNPAYCENFAAKNYGGCRGDGSYLITDTRNERIHSSFFGQSSFASYAIASARDVVKVRNDVPLKLLGPLGCGFQTGAGTVFNVLKPSANSSLAVIGAGAVGLAAIMAAKIADCREIVAVDRVASRLCLAMDLGATQVINTAETGDLSSQLKLRGGFDFVIDTTGVPHLVEAALGSLRLCGTCVLLGASKDMKITINLLDIFGGRVLTGVREGAADPQIFIPQLIEHFLSGAFPLDRLIKFYELDQINEAAADTESGVTIKAVLLV